MRVLFAASEVFPLAKTGGLADVAGSLPPALEQLGAELRVVTPAYPGSLERLRAPRRLATLSLRGQEFTIWEGRVQGEGPRIWLVDCAPLYDRPGDPYRDAAGVPFADNAWRFGCFSECVARLARGEGSDWRCDVVHLNDWQTGLVPVHLRADRARPRILFTIHNLAYQGVYPRHDFDALGLAPELWHMHALEFYGGFSFMKGGILYSDALTTVSPTYAQEIQTPRFGEGLDGLLRHRSAVLHGVLNGIDSAAWNPATDPWLPQRYDVSSVAAGKKACRRALAERMQIELDGRLLLGIVSRFAHQKGMDLFLAAMPQLLELPLQVCVLGAGEHAIEQGLQAIARRHPDRVAVRIGYDEGLAHLIEAGADVFLMASRYEPCGLNQMYSQRYGTIPVVHRVGGLADTVVDATAATLADGTASGVCFDRATAEDVVHGLRRALALRETPGAWAALQHAGMRRDFSWTQTAERYLSLMRSLPG